MMNPRKQGDAGEISAMQWFSARCSGILVPIGHSPNVDFAIELDSGDLRRVQVKTSTCWVPKGRWSVTLCTRGGNQSWNGIVKRLDPTRYDYLAVVVGDGRRWVIPSEFVEAASGLTLGGPKYSEFEVEAGPPLLARTDARIASG